MIIFMSFYFARWILAFCRMFARRLPRMGRSIVWQSQILQLFAADISNMDWGDARKARSDWKNRVQGSNACFMEAAQCHLLARCAPFWQLHWWQSTGWFK